MKNFTITYKPITRMSLVITLALIGTPIMAQSPGAYTDLHDFGATAGNTGRPDGAQPLCGVAFDGAGNMYGATEFGGANSLIVGNTETGDGTVWEITAPGVYKDLHDFGGTVTIAAGSSGPDGANPCAPVAFDPAGNMYGTTSAGGPNGVGMIWEITTSGSYLDLHDFGGTVTNADGTSGADGNSTVAAITIDSAGDLFGTAQSGGANNVGMIWEITAAGAYLDLHDFGGTVNDVNGITEPDGDFPQSGVTFDSSGNMYGTGLGGGANSVGMVWEITAAGVYEDLHDFGATITDADGTSGPDGTSPVAGVVFNGGNIYGTANAGGPNYVGMVWEIAASGDYQDLHDFGGTISSASGADGSSPVADVTFDSSGNIYGTASKGGASGFAGMLWQIAPSGQYTDLHDFGGTVGSSSGPDGMDPEAGVTLDPSGNLYGTTNSGGANNDGIIWKLSAPSSVTVPVTLPTPQTITTFSAGLQMIALPYSYAGDGLDSILGYTGVTLAVWDPVGMDYAVTPSAPANEILAGQGYWVRLPQTVSVTTVGAAADPTQNFSISLSAGWNQIGNPFTAPISVGSLDIAVGTSGAPVTFASASSGSSPLINGTLYGFNESLSSEYTPLIAAGTLQPGAGYWIYAYSAVTVIVPHP